VTLGRLRGLRQRRGSKRRKHGLEGLSKGSICKKAKGAPTQKMASGEIFNKSAKFKGGAVDGI